MQQFSFLPDAHDTRIVDTIDDLGLRLAAYMEPEQIQQVKRAYYYAEQAHEGQRRRSGEPYITHPLAVTGILADMRLDTQSLLAALLHDVIEDTKISRGALGEQFGDTVAQLVDGVSKLTRIEFASKAEAQAENFQKMALAMAKDIRVIIVKLADRLHNMRTLTVLETSKRRRIARETLEIYAPIAQRLGMHNVRVEFEDLGFAAMYPMRARRLGAARKAMRGGEGGELIEQIRDSITRRLQEDNLSAQVIGREKHLYGIYKKMQNKHKSFSDILDIYAFRIIVDSVDTCYRVLGLVHSLYKPVPGQFKDYIAIPKSNGYQSLHTVLFGRQGLPIEVQIRTKDMEELANYGISAHWQYKSPGHNNTENGSNHARATQWVRSLIEIQKRAGDSLEFIENVKIDLFPDEIYVFTPRGDIMELPLGATPVDFAFAVHTDIGTRCVAARVNRRMASLTQALENGQTVEVMTSPNAVPNPAWLQTVVTAKARSTIRHVLKNQRQSEAVALGRQMLDKALISAGSALSDVSDYQFEQLLKRIGVQSQHELLEQVGLGNRVPQITSRQLLSCAPFPGGQPLAEATSADSIPMAIRGTEGFLVNFAKCCYPIPGDEITGMLSSERGLVVHRSDCHNARKGKDQPDRWLDLTWADDLDREFPVELQVDLRRNRGLIAQLATRVSAANAGIDKISVEDRDLSTSTVHLTITVESRSQLAQVIRRLRSLPDVIRVQRENH